MSIAQLSERQPSSFALPALNFVNRAEALEGPHARQHGPVSGSPMGVAAAS